MDNISLSLSLSLSLSILWQTEGERKKEKGKRSGGEGMVLWRVGPSGAEVVLRLMKLC